MADRSNYYITFYNGDTRLLGQFISQERAEVVAEKLHPGVLYIVTHEDHV